MADISDIADYLVRQAAAAVYPNGTSQPSIANLDIRLYQGWPIPDQLDADMGGWVLVGTPPVKQKRSNGRVINVSVYPMPGAGAEPYEILDHTYVITQPVYGMSVTITNNVVSVTGQPNTGEYLSIILNRANNFSRTGANTAAIMTALLADIQAVFPGATGDNATQVTLPMTGTSFLAAPVFAIEARIGGVGLLGRATHRQRQMVMVTTWAPNDATRRLVAAAIDVALKNVIIDTMPDSSMAKFCYSRSNQTDEQQLQTVYRRDLIYECEYATLYTFPGYVITAPTVQVAGGNWGLPAPAPSPPTVNAIP